MWTIYFYCEDYHRGLMCFSSENDALYVFGKLEDDFPFMKDNFFLCKESCDSLKEIFSVVEENKS